MKHVLSPVDGSEQSHRALEFAARLAQDLNAKLTILAVRQYVVGRKAVANVWSDEETETILNEAKQIADVQFRKGALAIDRRSRDVAHAIVDYAEQHQVDLIVMGAAGKGSVKTFLIGSVSADVLKKSVCPVTVVH
ncbi:MAG: universal stress protein [Aestuariivirga sp.]